MQCMLKITAMIRRIFEELKHDLREMGANTLLVFGGCLVVVLLLHFLTAYIRKAGMTDSVSFQLVQLIIPFLGGYGSVMLMQSIMDTEGCEICFSYARSNLYWGIVRQIRFFIVYIFAVIIVCLLLSHDMDVEFVPFLRLLSAQCFALMSVGFVGICVSRKVSVGIVILIAIVSIQVTLGREYDIFNRLYLFTDTLVSESDLVLPVRDSIIIGVFCWPLGQTWVKP